MQSARFPTRRDALRLSVAGILGWSLPHCLALAAAGKSSTRAAAKNVLVILEQGGLSQMDTWDPKPELIKHHGGQMPNMDTDPLLKMRATRLGSLLGSKPATLTARSTSAIVPFLRRRTKKLSCRGRLRDFCLARYRKGGHGQL